MAERYDYEVVEEVKEDFYCVICLNLMKEAMQLKCGHGMCKSCLDDLRNSSEKRGVAFICPSCRDEIDNKEVHPVIMIDRITSSVKVKCENSKKGCKWIGELGNLKDHLNMECSFYPISCSFEHCEEKIERYALADHQSLCPYKTEACCYCKHICLSSELPEHYHTCQRYPVKCPNKCSDELMERQVVKYHRSMCSKETVECEFSSFGCNFMCTRESMMVHNQDASRHLSLTLAKFHEMNKRLERLQTQAEDCEAFVYKEKLLQLMTKDANESDIVESCLKKLYEPVVKEFDVGFVLFLKGLNWLKSKLKEVSEGKDEVSKNAYDALLHEYVKISEKSLQDLKIDVGVSALDWEKIEQKFKKEIPKIITVKGESFIKSHVTYENRFYAAVNRMNTNLQHRIEKTVFYKITYERPANSVYHTIGLSDDNFVMFRDNLLSCCTSERRRISLYFKKKGICCVVCNKNGNEMQLLKHNKVSIDVDKYTFNDNDILVMLVTKGLTA